MGSHLCERLLERGQDVVCMDNFFTGRRGNVAHLLDNPHFELIRHDVVDPFKVEVDRIFNLACPASPVHYQYNPIKTVKTSVVGAILGIQPFDQPNVQSAKDATAQVLRELSALGRLPRGEASFAVEDLGSRVRPGDYVAILAYIPQTDEADEVLSGLRRSIAERFHVATTLGYGPRYLHSTGQLHKGGPDTGVFLFLTAAHGRDLPIPGEAYTFGDLAGAQALGDMRALRSEGRRVARLELGADVVAAVRDLALKLNE